MSLSDKNIVYFNENWSYLKNGKLEPLTIPNKAPKGEKAIMYNKLPDEINQNLIICIETNQQTLQAYIDNMLIYNHNLYKDKLPFGSAFGGLWNLINIPKECQGKTIKLVLTTPLDMVSQRIYPITIGTKGATLLYLLKKCIGSIVFWILMSALGITFFISGILFSKKSVNFSYNSFIYLGTFSLMSAIWIIADSKFLYFFMSNEVAVYLLSFLTFFLIPIPFILYVRELSISKLRFSIISILFIIDFFVTLALYISNIVDIAYSVIINHILIVIAIFIILFTSYKEIKVYKNKNLKIIVYGMYFLAVFIIFNLIKFYTAINTNNSDLFRLGLFGFVVVISIGTVKRSLEVLDEYKALQQRLDISNLMVTMQQEQYEKLKFNIEEMSKTRHDLRHHILVIKGGIESKNYDNVLSYLNELSTTIEPEYSLICENIAVNAIVSHYISMAYKNNIKVDISIDIPKELPIIETDICIIIGNLLENALEACNQVTDNKFIYTKISVINNSIAIIVKNSSKNNIHIKDGNFISTKHSGNGIGTASIKSIAEKYNGVANFEYKDNFFKSSILINFIK